MSGVFEVLAADDSDRRLAARKALVLARTRIDKRLGRFLGAAKSIEEFDARYSLVGRDFAGIVEVACAEIGQENPMALVKTLHANYRAAGDKPPWLKDDDDDDDDGDEHRTEEDESSDDYKERHKHDDHEASVHEARTPKMCPYHSQVVEISLGSGDPQAGYKALADHTWGDNHCQGNWDGGCKFKREMVTRSYWDDRQKQLEDKRQQRDEVGQENVTDLAPDAPGEFEPAIEETIDEPTAEVIEFPSDATGESLAVEPVADAVPLAVAESSLQKGSPGVGQLPVDPLLGQQPTPSPAAPTPGPAGFTPAVVPGAQGVGGQVAAPGAVHPGASGVGGQVPAGGQQRSPEEEAALLGGAGGVFGNVRWSQFEVLADGNTDLDGPSPKIDKGKWTPESVKEIKVPSERHPTERKDVQGYERPTNEGDLEEINAVTTTESLPSETENAGFQGGGEDFGPATKTFPSGGREADPVSKTTLESKLAASMTRQHFQAIADAIKSAQGVDHGALANHFADHLTTTNDNFNRDRFLKAAQPDSDDEE